MKTIAIIPARGGSKRIPRKNIRDFCGRPILAYPIQAAKESGLFDRIIVSTDSEEVARVALKYGAEVPFTRPHELSDDYTGTNAVVKHCLKWLLDRGESISTVCCIYATAPLLQPYYLKKGFDILKKHYCAYAFSVTSFPFPIQRSVRIRPDGRIEPIFPEHVDKRSQDLEEVYHDAGQFYWGPPKSFLEDIPMFSADSMPVVLHRYLVQDIDTEEDWQQAEAMYNVLRLLKK